MFCVQANYPARVKALHMYNAGTVADLLMTVVKFCMSEKMQQRVCYNFTLYLLA